MLMFLQFSFRKLINWERKGQL